MPGFANTEVWVLIRYSKVWTQKPAVFITRDFVFGHEHLFGGGFLGLLPIELHYNYSAGMHPVPVMKWVLQWVDLSLIGHYSVFLLLGTRAEWQRIAAALAAWHSDRKRGGPVDQPQNHWGFNSVRRNGELHLTAQ